MPTGAIIALVIGGIILLLIMIIAGIYNSLVKANERVEEAWSDITVQLKRRSDLIPNLVETVKGYAKHETDAINQVSEARAKMMSARSVASTAEADRGFMGALSRLMAISEAYPELKANENFKQLSAELSDTEDKIQAARRFYNAGVKEMNTKVTLFPTNLINKLVGHFKKREYYEVDEAEKAIIKDAPKVKF
ncbi:LemA family protein [Candidatus Saccharibacteria bacterium]|nr:LemA family protein [Candidatus Saccharibacteria bacterium]